MQTRSTLLLLPALLFVLLCSCESGSQNALTFGTARDATGAGLAGESTTFTVGSGLTLWFRLESIADFDGRFVRLYFNSAEPRDFPACADTFTYICLSQFQVSTPGTYTVEAYLVKMSGGTAQETLVATQTLTLQ
ncbi:MAG: hypothetical protein QM765_51965 [Myxococcales bacterium]